MKNKKIILVIIIKLKSSWKIEKCGERDEKYQCIQIFYTTTNKMKKTNFTKQH